MGVVAFMNPPNPTSFISQVSQATLGAINCTMDDPPPFHPLDQIFQLLELELMGAFVRLDVEDPRFPK